jgi:hypothetical protein
MYEPVVPGGALNLNSTGYSDHGRYGDLPLQGRIHMTEPVIESGTSWLVVRCSDHQATRLETLDRQFIIMCYIYCSYSFNANASSSGSSYALLASNTTNTALTSLCNLAGNE